MSQERLEELMATFLLTSQLACECACLWLMVSVLPYPACSPFLFLFNVTGLAHMTLSSSVGTARARAASPAGALELDLQDKKKKRKRKNPSRSLIDISSYPNPLMHLSSPFLLSSFIQSTPLLICSPWWEEIYRDAVSLTSLSD